MASYTDSTTVTHGSSYSIRSQAYLASQNASFNRQYYKLLGWNTDSTATSAAYAPAATITNVQGSLSLYAIWSAGYSLYFHTSVIGNDIRFDVDQTTATLQYLDSNAGTTVQSPYKDYSCTSGQSIIFPLQTATNVMWVSDYGGITTIGQSAFNNCTSLSHVMFKTCKTVNTKAFKNTGLINITSAAFPACTTISDHAFTGCKSLQSVYFNSCKSIGACAFEDCTSLNDVYLPACQVIGAQAFIGCTVLGLVSIPSVQDMPYNPFVNCSNFSMPDTGGSSYFYRLTETNAVVSSRGVVLVQKSDSRVVYANAGAKSVSDSTVTAIGGAAFYSCSNLTYVRTPKCLSIGESAFWSCSNLRSLYLTDVSKVTSLGGANVFASTGATQAIPIATYVSGTMYDSFVSNGSWASVVSKHNVRILNYDTVVQIRYSGSGIQLSDLFFNAPNSTLTSSIVKSAFTTAGAIPYSSAWLSYLYIANSNVSIGKGCFSGTNLISVILPKVPVIGQEAFASCKSLQTVSIPACYFIESSAFTGCTSLLSISGSDVDALGPSAFWGCTALKDISFPNLNEMGAGAFGRCCALKNVNFPNFATSIPDHAFTRGVNGSQMQLETASFGTVTGIGMYAFSSCWSLQTFTCKSLTGSIGPSAFRDCSNLKEIDLKYCSSIGSDAFNGCVNLSKVYLRSTSRVAGNARMFSGVSTGLLKIYVPSDLVSKYKTAYYWSDFSSLIYSIT